MAVAVATAGGILVYAGFRGVNPVKALREVSSGKPAPVSTTGTPDATADQSSYTTAGGGPAGTVGAGPHPEFVQAALTHGGDTYSQSDRWGEKSSDCSSFIGKALKDNGVKPPGASVTLSYLTWTKAKTISKDQIAAGDFLCGVNHIGMAMGNGYAIGQQRPGVNVKVDTIDNIMYGQPGWLARRYTGTTGVVST